MAFFEDLGKKISSASQDAIAKTKDFADIAKLKSNVSDEEHRMETAYTEIGKLYAEKHLEDFEEGFGTFFDTIRDAKGKIEEYEKQIVEIKGVTKCPKCGAEVPRGTAFCGTCGSAITTNKELTGEEATNEEATGEEATEE